MWMVVMEWGISGKIQEKENCSVLFTQHGRQHYTERELDCGFLLPNCNFLFRLISGNYIYNSVKLQKS